MSIADAVLNIVIFLIQKLLLPILPTEFPILTLETLKNTLSEVQNNLVSALAPMNFFMPVNFFLGLLLFVLTAELLLIVFRMGVFIINLFRGSGA